MLQSAEQSSANGEASRTAYDEVTYVSNVMKQTDPDRLCAIARLHGIDAPAAATARVLEVGGGDGSNMIGFAAAFPDSHCISFDLAPTAVARGRALAAAARVGNVAIERLDILDAADALDGEFDYIIVHGVYAWVPEHVRAAIFDLIGRKLSATGVAHVSYNALPGQTLSVTLRGMIGEMLADLPPGIEKAEQAQALLRTYAEEASDQDNSLVKALRARARMLADRPKWLLAHDEFGHVFEPQLFSSVCAAAAGAGLRYLNDSAFRSWPHGFAGEDIDEATLLRSIQIDDYRVGTVFRNSLFVRAENTISRTLDLNRVRDLFMTSDAEPVTDTKFRFGGESFTLGDQRAALIVREAFYRYPAPVALAGMDDERALVFARLFLSMAVRLGTTARARGGAGSDRPCLSHFARAQAEDGARYIAGLDQTAAEYSDDFRRVLLMLDGTRDIETLARDVGFSVAEASAFVAMAARRALFMPVP